MTSENAVGVVEFLNPLLTPAIAILTAYIAVMQYLLAKARHRHELYERRSAVFKAAMAFIAEVKRAGDARLEDLHTFLRDTSEVGFLFEKNKAEQIKAFLEELYRQAVDLRTKNEELESPKTPEDERERIGEEQKQLVLWFSKQSEECYSLFAPDLSLV
jgi:hypothetical protein